MEGKGLCVLTESDITDMNRYLLRKEASFSRLRLSNFINANREYIIKATGWFFHRDEQGRITASLCFNYTEGMTSLFGENEAVIALLEECEWIGTQEANKYYKGEQFAILFAAADEHLLPLLDNYFGRKGQPRKTKGAFDLWVISDHKTFNDTKLKPLVEGDYMDSLNEADAATVDSLWPYRNSQSLASITDCIKNRASVCIRRKGEGETDEAAKGRLVAWSLLRADYQEGMTHTVEECRGLGYGKRVAYGLVGKVLDLQRQRREELQHEQGDGLEDMLVPYCFIDPDNKISQEMFNSMGFVKRTRHYWTRY